VVGARSLSKFPKAISVFERSATYPNRGNLHMKKHRRINCLSISCDRDRL
jgi:hypothetical protein